MSPYDHKFVDVKFGGMVTGSVTITLEEVQQRWRYILLAVGIVLLFLAPIVSEWVPFYYASSMVIGIITVVLIILYQARILLPTGRRNSFYLAIVCSVIGSGSFLVHHISAFLNSVLLNFGVLFCWPWNHPFRSCSWILAASKVFYFRRWRSLFWCSSICKMVHAYCCKHMYFPEPQGQPFGYGGSGVLFGTISCDREDKVVLP